MAEDTEDIKLSTVTHIPRLMLIMVAVNLALWFGILPAIYGLTHGQAEWLQVALVGLLMVPVSLMLLFIGRLIYYFMTLFYWYFAGCGALLGLLLAGTYIIAAFAPSSPPPLGFRPAALLNLIPDGLLSQVSGIVLVALALLAVFLLGRFTVRRPKAPAQVSNVVSAEPDPLAALTAHQAAIRQQLQQRSQRLKSPPTSRP